MRLQLRASLASAETRSKRLEKQLQTFKVRSSEDARTQQGLIAQLEADVKRKSHLLEQLQVGKCFDGCLSVVNTAVPARM